MGEKRFLTFSFQVTLNIDL